jgi:DNA modification methylase
VDAEGAGDMSQVSWRILEGDCRETLATLPAGSVQTCVTSPPYFGLRDYGRDGQMGLEPQPDEFVAVFREVRRVLADDGTVWLNLGDSYSAYNGNAGMGGPVGLTQTTERPKLPKGHGLVAKALKPKDLIGIPWMVAFALRADGWFLRSEIIWAKRNCMPESVTDRPTRAHEQIFLLSKRPRYFYDHDAIREEDLGRDHARTVLDGQPSLEPSGGLAAPNRGLRTVAGRDGLGRNKRSVWTVATQPFPGAHFATFPPKLIEPCILAGCPEGGTVLDPFAGAGTTGMVALRHGRSFIGCELNHEYVQLGRERIIADSPLLNTHAEAA